VDSRHAAAAAACAADVKPRRSRISRSLEAIEIMGVTVCRIPIPPLGVMPSSVCCMEDTIPYVSQNVNACSIDDGDTTPDMDRTTPAERLKTIRERRGFASAAAASAAHGWAESTYRSHENGTKAITVDAAWKYCSGFRANPGWLLFGSNYVTTSGKEVLDAANYPPTDIAWRRIPVLNVKMLLRDKNLQSTLNQSTEFVIIPGEEHAGPLTFAHRVVDDSMLNPSTNDGFRPGDMVIFDGERKPTPGDYVLASLKTEDACAFRQYRLGGKDENGDEVVILVPINPNYPMERIINGKTGGIVGRLVCHHRRY